MPAKRINRVGARYGHWTIIRFDKQYGPCDARWICRCDCGVERSVIFRSIRGGNSLSCGCFGATERAKKNTKHGMAGTPTYKSWHQMHQRCSGRHGHDHYLRNGVKVCERWNDFSKFYADMGDRPFGTTLDRIDGSKGYEPFVTDFRDPILVKYESFHYRNVLPGGTMDFPLLQKIHYMYKL